MVATNASFFFENLEKTLKKQPYNSDCMQDSFLIPTAEPVLFKSGNSMNLFSILLVQAGVQKSKMADHKAEILIFAYCIQHS